MSKRGAPAGEPAGNTPAEIDPEEFRRWVVEKIEEFLDLHPEVTLQELATSIGVSTPTLSRWKSGQLRIATTHKDRILDVLGLGERDLVARYGTAEVRAVRARGPLRTRGAFRTRGILAAAPDASAPPTFRSAHGVPRRIYAVLIRGAFPDSLAWLRRPVERAHEAFRSLLERPARDPDAFRLGRQENVVLAPERPDSTLVDELLDGVRLTARPDDMTIAYASACLTAEEDGFHLALEPGGAGPRLLDLADRLSRTARTSLLVLEGHWPDEGRSFPGPGDRQLEMELTGPRHEGLSVLLTALPTARPRASDRHGVERRLAGELLRDAVRTGQADQNGDGVITLAELADHLSQAVEPRNRAALEARARGDRVAVTPVPRLIACMPDAHVPIAWRRRPASDSG